MVRSSILPTHDGSSHLWFSLSRSSTRIASTRIALTGLSLRPLRRVALRRADRRSLELFELRKHRVIPIIIKACRQQMSKKLPLVKKSNPSGELDTI